MTQNRIKQIMDFEEIKTSLQEVDKNFSSRDSISLETSLKRLKEKALENNDQNQAKYIWCLERILEVQDKYIKAYFELKSGAFYRAWCTFEEADLAIHFLNPHLDDHQNKYKINFISEHINRYQKIFPYKIFMSTEIIDHEISCTICNKKISIRNSCGHIIGEIYNGEMCARRIDKADFLGIALVESPMHKYSVPFMVKEGNSGKDHYNYCVVKYLVDRLSSPFDEWDFSLEKERHPHSRYKKTGRNKPCPCKSGLKYKKCCLRESGILRPHYQFIFSVPPPQEMLYTVYSD